MKLPKSISKIVTAVANSVSQTSGTDIDESFGMAQGIDTCCKQAATESIIMLKNDSVLPLGENTCVSLFGRVQSDTFFVGYGSGGDVKSHYKVSYREGLENAGVNLNKSLLKTYDTWRKKHVPDDGFWGHWPMCYEEMPLNDILVSQAAAESDCAVVFIGRAAGEDRENTLTKGSFLLTDEEEHMLTLVKRYFKSWTVVLNIGNIIDLSWVEKFDVPALLLAWQGGMETGNALAQVLTGKVSPSGALTDTVARDYSDYPSSSNFGGKKRNIYEEDIFVGYRYFETFAPDKVLYPFGFGLSYTEFSLTPTEFSYNDGSVKISVTVKNTGKYSGKRAVGLYVGQTSAELPVPSKVLKAFKKTKELQPEESENITFSLSDYDISSFDDSGVTGFKNSYVLCGGHYRFEVGFNIEDTVCAGEITVEKTRQTVALSEVSAPEHSFMRLRPLLSNGKISNTYEPTPTRTVSLKEEILKNLPTYPKNGTKGDITLDDVKSGKNTLPEFVSTLTDEELEAISRGDYTMNSPLGAKGNAGVFGGVLASLREKGVSPVTTTDGPSGIRIAARSALLPCASALASTWNCELVEEVYSLLGKEMRERGSDVLLAPGMNIHRNPLCGRNFEYYSEDPVISGYMAAAVTKGLQSSGVSACPKHFACNNQEVRRTTNDSVLSQRALREIYLKGFEICVKTAKPLCLMTSYNKINGVWGHYNYDLVSTILRKEWGYDGCVVTDWWMQPSTSPEFPLLKNQAYRVRAGINVLMPGGGRTGKKVPDGTLLSSIDAPDGITRAELQKNAEYVIKMQLKLEELRKKELQK